MEGCNLVVFILIIVLLALILLYVYRKIKSTQDSTMESFIANNYGNYGNNPYLSDYYRYNSGRVNTSNVNYSSSNLNNPYLGNYYDINAGRVNYPTSPYDAQYTNSLAYAHSAYPYYAYPYSAYPYSNYPYYSPNRLINYNEIPRY